MLGGCITHLSLLVQARRVTTKWTVFEGTYGRRKRLSLELLAVILLHVEAVQDGEVRHKHLHRVLVIDKVANRVGSFRFIPCFLEGKRG